MSRSVRTSWCALAHAALPVVVAASLGLVAAAPAAANRAAPRPVASLEPVATQKAWERLVAHPRRLSFSATLDCRPARAVFYAQTDWLRLAVRRLLHLGAAALRRQDPGAR